MQPRGDVYASRATEGEKAEKKRKRVAKAAEKEEEKRKRVARQLSPPSGFYGVTAHKKRWKARIRYDGKQHHLGSFGTKQEAALAYDREARLKGCTFQCALNYGSIAAAEAAVTAAAKPRKSDKLPRPPPPRPPSGRIWEYTDGGTHFFL
jgi:hypothetical protein